MEDARGCCDPFSIAAVIAKNSSSLPPKVTRFVTVGTPLVNVPVLSNAIAFKAPASSKWIPPLINTPFLAALPIAVTIATGVETTKAHGQPTTSTAKPS